MDSITRKETAAEKGAVSLIYATLLALIAGMTFLSYGKDLSNLGWEIKMIIGFGICLIGIRFVVYPERWNTFAGMVGIIAIAMAALVLANACFHK